MSHVYIIAEAGVNHNGDINIAKQLVDVAKASNADAIKFQTFTARAIASKNAAKAEYQKKRTPMSESQFEMLEKLELSYAHHKELLNYCKERKIQFLSTPFDIKSIDFLLSIDIPIWKIPSGEITNLPYLLKIAQTGKPVIMSSGMSTTDEIENAVSILKENGSGKITILHCNSEYPTPYEDINLNAMLTIQRKLGVDVGLSDHTPGIEVPVAAVALGATVIEKHFTLDKNAEGPDHKASLNPGELAAMVTAIRNIEKALGTGVKIPSPSEMKNIDIARKSIVAACSIRKGEILTEENVTTKRPGTGISPMRWFDVLGKAAIRDFAEDDLIGI